MVVLRRHFVDWPALVAQDCVAVNFGSIGIVPFGSIDVVVAQLSSVGMSGGQVGPVVERDGADGVCHRCCRARRGVG